jgi:hypothetical protein
MLSSLTGASPALNSSQLAQTITGCFSVHADKPSTGESYDSPLVQVAVKLFVPCDLGHSSATGDNLLAACQPCQLGSFSTATGAQTCTDCSVNHPRTLDAGANSSSLCQPCPLGEYCPLNSNPLPCPARGTYESLAHAGLLNDRDPLQCEPLVCLNGWWCGAGAAEGTTYRAVLSAANVTTTVLVKATRTITVPISNLDPNTAATIYLLPEATAAFVTSVTSSSGIDAIQGLLVPANSTIGLLVTLSGTLPDSTATFDQGNIALAWQSDPSINFTLTIPTQIDLTSVIVTPLAFTYQVELGDTTFNPLPNVQIFNTLCNNSITYLIRPCAAVPWFSLPSINFNEAKTIPQERGLPDSLTFALNFNQSAEDDQGRAALLQTCFNVDVTMNGLGLNATFTVNITAQLKRPCAPGTISATGDNLLGCSLCSRGYYQNATRQNSCTQCSALLPVTLQEGANSSALCTARAGNLVYNGQSVPCPVGTDCSSADGTTVETLVLSHGYWRSTRDTLNVHPCPHPIYCKGGQISQSSRRALSAADVLCIPHHEGPFCASCEASYVKRGADHICALCDGAAQAQDSARLAGIFVGLVLLLIAVFGIAFLRLWAGFKAHQDEAAKAREVSTRIAVMMERVLQVFDFGTKTRILLGLYQVLGGMAVNLEDSLPAIFRTLSQAMSILTLDFINLLDMGCSLPEQDHLSSLYLTTLLPLLICLCVMGSNQLAQTKCLRNWHMLAKDVDVYAWSGVLIVLFLVYPLVSATILRTFQCETLEDGAVSLVYDPSVNCLSDAYASAHAYAIFATMLYIVGIPCMYFALLYRHRRAINPPMSGARDEAMIEAMRDEDKSIAHLRFLFRSYHPRFYWFEIFELLRKLAQISLLVFVTPGSTIQVIFELAMTFVVIAVLSGLRPYVNGNDTFLAVAAQWTIFAVAFLALLLRSDSILIQTAAQSPLYEQTTLYTMQTILLFLCPVIALGLFAAEIHLLARIQKRYQAGNTKSEEAVAPQAVLDGEEFVPPSLNTAMRHPTDLTVYVTELEMRLAQQAVVLTWTKQTEQRAALVRAALEKRCVLEFKRAEEEKALKEAAEERVRQLEAQSEHPNQVRRHRSFLLSKIGTSLKSFVSGRFTNPPASTANEPGF